MGQIKNDILLEKIILEIRRLRIEKGITHEKFYMDTSIHIGRIESGKQNITISTLDAICQYLGITVKEFFNELD
jgi:transcriptional regulator with XRE-family HTH domain